MRMNYDSVRRDMKKLRALAEECEASVATCTKYQNEISQYWEGDSANAYKEGLRKLKTKHQKLAQDIERAASLIQSVADDMEEEDRRLAAEIARKKMAAELGAQMNANVFGAKTSSGGSKTAASTAKAITNTVKNIAKSSSSSPKTGSTSLGKAVSNLVSKLFGKG